MRETLAQLLAPLAVGFCPYGCKYYYLAGTQGVKFSPTVKIYVNLPEMLEEINRIARRLPAVLNLAELRESRSLSPMPRVEEPRKSNTVFRPQPQVVNLLFCEPS